MSSITGSISFNNGAASIGEMGDSGSMDESDDGLRCVIANWGLHQRGGGGGGTGSEPRASNRGE